MSLRSFLTGSAAAGVLLTSCHAQPLSVEVTPKDPQTQVNTAFQEYRRELGRIFSDINQKVDVKRPVADVFAEANEATWNAYLAFRTTLRDITNKPLESFGYFEDVHHSEHNLCIQGEKVRLDVVPVFRIAEQGTVTCEKNTCSYENVKKTPGTTVLFDISDALRRTQGSIRTWPHFSGNFSTFSSPLHLLDDTGAATLSTNMDAENLGYVMSSPASGPFQIVFKNGNTVAHAMTVNHELTHALLYQEVLKKNMDREAPAFLSEFQAVPAEKVYPYIWSRARLRLSPDYAFAATLPADLVHLAINRAYEKKMLPEVLQEYTPDEKDAIEFLLYNVLRPRGWSSEKLDTSMEDLLRTHITIKDVQDVMAEFEKRIFNIPRNSPAWQEARKPALSYSSTCSPASKPVLAVR